MNFTDSQAFYVHDDYVQPAFGHPQNGGSRLYLRAQHEGRKSRDPKPAAEVARENSATYFRARADRRGHGTSKHLKTVLR